MKSHRNYSDQKERSKEMLIGRPIRIFVFLHPIFSLYPNPIFSLACLLIIKCPIITNFSTTSDVLSLLLYVPPRCASTFLRIAIHTYFPASLFYSLSERTEHRKRSSGNRMKRETIGVGGWKRGNIVRQRRKSGGDGVGGHFRPRDTGVAWRHRRSIRRWT